MFSVYYMNCLHVEMFLNYTNKVMVAFGEKMHSIMTELCSKDFFFDNCLIIFQILANILCLRSFELFFQGNSDLG